MSTDTPPPVGYWKDGNGHLVPIEMVKPIDKARDQLVQELVRYAKAHADALARFKAAAFGDIAAFVDLSAEQYGVKFGGKKGNVQLMSFDGRYKVLRAVQDSLVFDERLQIAKQLIDECVREWSQDARPELRVLINDAFQVDKQGRINTGRVLGLKRLAINDEKWKAAMDAITDSLRSVGSSTYLRFYERVGDTDQYRPISLDLACV